MWNVTGWQKVVFSDKSRFVLVTDDNRVLVWRRPGKRLFHGRPAPDLSPVEHVWDQIKRQMPSCHSVHDLELAVQDLCAHLPQDNNNHDVKELWFQQDGATCHTARATIDLLKDTFGDRLIARFGPVNWPPRSCDLTPLDYFLWGYVKSLVYADKPQTLDHLEDNIRRVIADIRPQMLEKVIENWTSRLDYIRASRGSHMPEIIFKM
ncbi:heat shock 70kDa protein 8 [Trichonephila clavipes]|nr:heat shock 70kDa protein 8 [Trichonephila clavipes]